MAEDILKRIILASIKAFPIDEHRKETLLRRILEETRNEEHGTHGDT